MKKNLSTFISTSLQVSGNYVPIISRTYCIYATLVFFTVWVAVCSADHHISNAVYQISFPGVKRPGRGLGHPPSTLCRPDGHSYSEKYQCRVDTVSSPDDGHIVPRNMYRIEINILRSNVHLVGFFKSTRTHNGVRTIGILFIADCVCRLHSNTD